MARVKNPPHAFVTVREIRLGGGKEGLRVGDAGRRIEARRGGELRVLLGQAFDLLTVEDGVVFQEMDLMRDVFAGCGVGVGAGDAVGVG